MMQLSREERMLDVKSMTNVRDLGGYQMMRKNIFMIMELECK